MQAMMVAYYGMFLSISGCPSDTSSTRFKARHTSVEENTKYVFDAVSEFAKGPWEVCDFGIPGTSFREVDLDVRASQRSNADNWLRHRSVLSKALRLVAQRQLVDVATVKFCDFEILKYDEGGLFAEHMDRARGEGHIGTLLLIAPCVGMLGGALVDGSGVSVVENPSAPHLVFIPLGVAHAVTKVEHGQRLVLKAAVHGTGAHDSDMAETFLAAFDF
jgi:hypothetical protein